MKKGTVKRLFSEGMNDPEFKKAWDESERERLETLDPAATPVLPPKRITLPRPAPNTKTG
jgi:hypothetical protein